MTTEIFTLREALFTLRDKMDPRTMPGWTDKTYCIISLLLGTDWVTNSGWGGGFCITTDSLVMSGGVIVCRGDEFRANVAKYARDAGLTEEETWLFWARYDTKVVDYQVKLGYVEDPRG